MSNKAMSRKPKAVKFVNNKGQVGLVLPDNLTLEQLYMMGIRLELVPKDLPIADGQLAHNPAHYPGLTDDKWPNEKEDKG